MEVKTRSILLEGIPHKGEELTFQYPAFRGTYGNVAKQIDKAGLKRPTSAETASLVYDAFQNPNGKYESEIINILKDRWLWEFTGNLYLPKSNEEINNGVILETNPKIVNGRLYMDKDSLIKRLQNNDSLVKFVPFGYKTGEQNSLELMKNPYVVGRYGKEGAEKIAEIASKYRKNPYLYSFYPVDEEITRMSIGECRDFSDRLYVNGYHWDNGDEGHTFGVYTPEEDK